MDRKYFHSGSTLLFHHFNGIFQWTKVLKLNDCWQCLGSLESRLWESLLFKLFIYTTIVRDFNITHSVTDRTRRQKISKDIIEQDSIIHQVDLIDIYGILHPVTVECMVFLSLKGRFAKLEHTLGHKTNFNKFKRTDIIRSVLSDNNEIRWEIINRNIARKSWDIWRLNSTHK